MQVLIVDDHPLFRDALKSTVSAAFPDAVTVDAVSLDNAVEILHEAPSIDLALFDLGMPDVHGFEGLLRLRKGFPRLPILVVSGLEERDIVQRALEYGAAGFVPKSAGKEAIAAAVVEVMQGSVYVPANMDVYDAAGSNVDEGNLEEKLNSLTLQQLRVLGMLREGMLNKQIAVELSISPTTVKAHVSEILRKLEVGSRTQAVIAASRIDFTPPSLVSSAAATSGLDLARRKS